MYYYRPTSRLTDHLAKTKGYGIPKLPAHNAPHSGICILNNDIQIYSLRFNTARWIYLVIIQLDGIKFTTQYCFNIV